MTRLTVAQRIRFGLLFAAFEGGMPIIGLLVGVGVGRVIGGWSEYVAIAALAGLGAYMLFGPDKDDERVQRLVASPGAAMIVLGLSVSLDELAIGFGLGLLNVPIVPAVVLIAAQAFIVSQVGFAIGGRIGAATRERSEAHGHHGCAEPDTGPPLEHGDPGGHIGQGPQPALLKPPRKLLTPDQIQADGEHRRTKNVRKSEYHIPHERPL